MSCCRHSPGRRLPEPPQEANLFVSALGSFVTFFAFTTACALAPWILFLYLSVKVARKWWLWWLETRFPGLEFVRKTSPRTAVDTMRNQGIITVLLKVGGATEAGALKRAILEKVVRKGHLQRVLTSRWGRYAWVRGSEAAFAIDNHLLPLQQPFKGRPLSDANIQEFMSDIVSKLLPPDIPPWQVIVANTQSGSSYLLIRLHHLYLSEDRLTLGDLLMLKQAQPSGGSDESDDLLTSMFSPPIVIPQVAQHMSESLSNLCNELVSKHDPLENPDILKQRAGPGLMVSLVVATGLAVWREWARGGGAAGGSLLQLGAAEAGRRGLTLTLALRCFLAALRPLAFLSAAFSLWLHSLRLLLSAPFIALQLLKDSPVYLYWLYLAHYVVQEVFYFIGIVYSAPRIIFEELFLPEHPRNVHRLQTLSLCGRKVVSWSEPVPNTVIDTLKQATGASTAEILLSTTAACIREYFEEAGLEVPDSLLTSCRVVRGRSLVGPGGERGLGEGGVMGLGLPLGPGPAPSLGRLRAALARSRSRQPPLYLASRLGLLTRLFPSLLARACLYLLSRKYTVGLTLVTSDEPSPRQLVWGSEVDNIMYWRPPQANACLSVTVLSYAGKVQLGVMADGQLAPQHAVITRAFRSKLNLLAASSGLSPQLISSS